MSCYIKFNGWAGEDMLGTTSRVAKIFGMSVGKGSSVIPIIIRDGELQYQ